MNRFRWSISRVEHVPAYSHVACFYDHLMRHVNYLRWAEYVIDLFRLASAGPAAKPFRAEKPLRVQRVLELACGTGKMLAELSRAGYTVFGLDSSYEMVKHAAARLAEVSESRYSFKNLRKGNRDKYASGRVNAGSNLQTCRLANLQTCHVWCGDMRSFAIATPVDAVICLYDSFNYCLEPRDVRQLLARVAESLRPGGLFIFDVCTQRNCRKNFRNYYERDGFKEFSYIRRAYFRPLQKIQINEFIITNESISGPPIYERHQQRIYSLQDIRAMIAADPWALAGCFDGMSRRPGTERSDRVHFVLKRL